MKRTPKTGMPPPRESVAVGLKGLVSVGLFDAFKKKNFGSSGQEYEIQRRELLRHYEILKDCEDLINNSPSFATVVLRYDLMLDELGYFAAWETYGVDYLQQYGFTFKTPASALWKSSFDGKAKFLNSAVDRLLDLEIDGALVLKTKSGQEKRMLSWVDKMQGVESVPVDTLKYLSDLPVLDALRDPKVLTTCRCGVQFRCRPHAYQGYIVICPKCGQRLRVDTSGKQGR